MTQTPRTDTGIPTDRAAPKPAYEIFMAVLTVFSLAVLAVLVIDQVAPFEAHAPSEIVWILTAVDLLFCGLFFVDWLRSLRLAPDRVAYMFGERPGRSVPYGTLELLGTIPYSFLFRFLRFARLWRAGWHLSDLSPRALARDIAASRAEAAVYITTTVALLVILFGSIFVLLFELEEPTASIDSSSDALWWAFVTITTVGYGDEVPVTEGGRVVAVLTMVVGIAIFGVIAGSLSRLLADRDRSALGPDERGGDLDAVARELAALRAEVAELRRTLESRPR